MRNVEIYLTIRRPNGTTEEVPWTKSDSMNQNLFAQIQATTRNAGRGDVLTWRAVEPQDPRSEAEKALDDVLAAQARAEAIRESGGVSEYFHALHWAEALMEAWQANHPAAAAERVEALKEEKAERQARILAESPRDPWTN